MPKDYPASNAFHAPPAPRKAAYNDIRDQFTATSEMRASTLSYALHARTRELDVALAKIAILELRIKYLEQNPLVVAYERLQATEQAMVWVGEMACPAAPTGRLRECGTLLDVMTWLAGRYEVFSTQRIEVSTEKKAS